jgi:molybdopterin-containing oxidoreductase family iron-sulfur binding subunit
MSSNKTTTDSKNTYWRSLDQKNHTPAYQQFVEREFPEGAEQMANPVTRRNFMKIMGASAGLAGLTACRMPKEDIVPFVKAPENVTPGKAKFYATSMNMDGHALALLAQSTDGRPTKIEGNDMHPSSNGGAHAWAQASVLGLYDQDRHRVVTEQTAPKKWSEFETAWRSLAAQHKEDKGLGLAVISGQFNSPTFDRLQKEFMAMYPKATWVTSGGAYTRPALVQSRLNLKEADVIVSFDHDFLGTDLDKVRNTKDYAAKRKVHQPKDTMNRLYQVEAGYTLTGANADHRLAVDASQIKEVLKRLYQLLSASVSMPALKSTTDNQHDHWLKAVAKDLLKNKGRSVVTADLDRGDTETYRLIAQINRALGNSDQTISFYDNREAVEAFTNAAKQWKTKKQNKQLKTVVVLGDNPIYTFPAQWDMANTLDQTTTVIVANQGPTETSAKASWTLPLSHYLESWGDHYSPEGQQTLVQPLIRPLFDSKSHIEILRILTHLSPMSGYELVQDTHKNVDWNQALHRGFIRQKERRSLGTNVLSLGSASAAKTAPSGIEVEFKVSPSVYDGRFANNGWLQELPHPITKIAWDNPAMISPALAKEKGLSNGQMIELSKDGQTISLPVWIVPGQAKNTITVEFGYGRNVCGNIGHNVGYNVYPLRSEYSQTLATGVTLNALATSVDLATTQDHGTMEGRPIVREATLSEFRQHPEFAKEMVEHPPLKSLWKEHDYSTGYQWGMVIDLNACTGCNACVISCQSENNIPIVGKEQVKLGREMHWMRMDRYFSGDEEDPMVVFQPMACVHCENAPCEQVCPVNATVHDDEGLNVMVYNRCIGTRYCSNNCPYKVRRFNFFNYVKESPLNTKKNPLVQMAHNPEVSVRFRGVMEKCTYCTQRIETARSKAKVDNRSIADGDIVTACQQACPADAIVFGNINDPDSQVSKLKKLNHDYALLAELNNQPRTTFLAKLRNPNPELVTKTKTQAHGSHA